MHFYGILCIINVFSVQVSFNNVISVSFLSVLFFSADIASLNSRICLTKVMQDSDKEEYSFERGLVLTISARNLKGGSLVWFKAAKSGVKLGSQSFTSNKKGELDLEVKTGKRKGGAMGEIHYFDMRGKKYVKQMKVKVI